MRLLLFISAVLAIVVACASAQTNTTTNVTSSTSTSATTTTTDVNASTVTTIVTTNTSTTTTGTTTSQAPTNTTTTTTTTTETPVTTPAPPNFTEAPVDTFKPAGPGPVDIRPIRNVTCPFARWQGDPRTCFECRWCPFKKSTCCEIEDEIAVLKSVNVSGSTDWDCFITIVHFQQCGRCDPEGYRYLMNKTLNYVWDPRGVSIRPCKQACKYIYGQCKGVRTLANELIIPDGMDQETFCQDYPELSSAEVPCFESAGQVSAVAALIVAVLVAVLM